MAPRMSLILALLLVSPCASSFHSRSERSAFVRAFFPDGTPILRPSDLPLRPSRLSGERAHRLELECEPERAVDCSGQLVRRQRTINGTCNNLRWPLWGSAGTSFRRITDPLYADGKGEPFGRSESKGDHGSGWEMEDCLRRRRRRLPSARRVSTEFHPDVDAPSTATSLMFMQFGQFLDHDLTLTVEPEHDDSHNCCSDAERNKTGGACFPILVSSHHDSFWPCMNFTRSSAFCNATFPYREQRNGITAFVDASNVYGSDDATALQLRALAGGRLRVTTGENGQELLPTSDDADGFALRAGDDRVGEMPGLMAVHTLFVREHNRLAGDVAAENPSLTDEQVYQQARKILIAEMQHVVYAEYLPVVFGAELAQSEGLISDAKTRYDPNVDPSALSSFATAAFRFGHSLIQGSVHVKDIHSESVSSFALRANFFNTTHYFDDDDYGNDRILYGMVGQPSQHADRFMSRDVTDFVRPGFRQPVSDLVARNVQRGRDHGLPGYNDFRRACNLRPVCRWTDVPTAEFDAANWGRLSLLYEHPGDVDLFAAGMGERLRQGAMVGRTFACILARQFRALRSGDRFFYTHDNGHHGLTDQQIRDVKNRTLAKIICDNTRVPKVPKNVFLLNSETVNCEDL